MRSEVEWLRSLERRAGDVYRSAALAVRDDPPLCAFLERLSEDEACHQELIESAGRRLLNGKCREAPAVAVDAQTRRAVEEPLRTAEQLVASRRFARKQMLECIVEIEFSEWNELFVYFVNIAREPSKDFDRALANIEAHRERVERFLDTLPAAERPERGLTGLPSLWERSFLLVDDDPELLALLTRVLRKRARIETATNGREGLQKARERFFDLIVSDIQMPEMDGLEFCRRAVETEPRLRDHFLMCSGAIDREHEEFLRREQLAYLPKPFTLRQLDRAVDAVLRRVVERA